VRFPRSQAEVLKLLMLRVLPWLAQLCRRILILTPWRGTRGTQRGQFSGSVDKLDADPYKRLSRRLGVALVALGEPLAGPAIAVEAYSLV
jgi:hypothetical protein